MKKKMIVALVAALAIGLIAAGAAFAQGNEPPAQLFGLGQMTRGDGTGTLHDYMQAAFAAELDLTVDELNARLDAGETMLDMIGADNFSTVMADARSAALDAALADGVITQEQSEWMKTRGAGRGGDGLGTGVCDGSGSQGGAGMQGQGGRGGGRWQ